MKAWMRLRETNSGKPGEAVPLEVGMEQREDTIVLTIRIGTATPRELDIWVMETDLKRFMDGEDVSLPKVERDCQYDGVGDFL